MRLLALVFAALFSLMTAAPSPVIDASNVSALGLSLSIDYAKQPAALGRLESGGFSINADASRIAVRSREDAVVIWDGTGQPLDRFDIKGADGYADTILDTAFNASGSRLVAIASDGASYVLAVRLLDEQRTLALPFPKSPDTPLKAWFDGNADALWVEATPFDPGQHSYVAHIPFDPTSGAVSGAVTRLDSGPENDADSYARVGRVAPPRAITTTASGTVKLWDLRTGDVTASADVGVPTVFGGLDASATHFAWRDPYSQELHLLDFTTGQDKPVATLDGAYISFITLSKAADVILGVHVASQPVVVAWNTATGQRLDLGAFRSCRRTPDMARISADGTTLVIGCDSGIDIWKVKTA